MTPKSVLIPVIFDPLLVKVNVLPTPVKPPEMSSSMALPE